MRLLIQRVSSASLFIDSQCIRKINTGLVVLVGFGHKDTNDVVDKLVPKLLDLRIFADANDKMNLSVTDVKGDLLIVSQFTLYADCRKGNRPSFTEAAKPEQARQLYTYFVEKCTQSGLTVKTGEFGAYMQVSLVNDGPVTIQIEQ